MRYFVSLRIGRRPRRDAHRRYVAAELGKNTSPKAGHIEDRPPHRARTISLGRETAEKSVARWRSNPSLASAPAHRGRPDDFRTHVFEAMNRLRAREEVVRCVERTPPPANDISALIA
jgi:hypothetical protein